MYLIARVRGRRCSNTGYRAFTGGFFLVWFKSLVLLRSRELLRDRENSIKYLVAELVDLVEQPGYSRRSIDGITKAEWRTNARSRSGTVHRD